MGANTSSSVIAQHVEQASKTGVCALREQKLEIFPEALLSLHRTLRTLDLYGNRLVALPPNLGEFANLKSLNLAHNKLVQIPESIGNMKKLENVHLEHNAIATLPVHALGNLKALKSINLSHNKLETFPHTLCQLAHLDFADLSTNSIKELPEEIEHLSAIELNLNQNGIAVLPEALAKCKRLKVLRVEENVLELGGLPPAILSESKVSLLCVDGNLFQNRELQELPQYEQYMERYTATRRKTD